MPLTLLALSRSCLSRIPSPQPLPPSPDRPTRRRLHPQPTPD